MTLTCDRTSPRRDATSPNRRSSRAGRALVVAVFLPVLLTSCTTDDPEPSTDPTSATSGAIPSSQPPSTTVAEPSSTPPPTTSVSPEQQAAADAEDAYRRNTAEGFRHLDTALREAAAQHPGVYIRTPELDAILQAVATDPDYNARAGEPAIILQDVPTAIGYAGSPVVTQVRVDSVELNNPPQTINGQDGVMGTVTLTACKDVTSIRTLGPGDTPLFPESGPRILLETVTVRQQPHFLSGISGWYVAERTNTVEETCGLS